jgi:RNA polymerase sigma-70 factor (ECF subfamily)
MAVGKALSYREIAEICGTTEANVKVRVHRARKKLRSMMEDIR